ncbi:PhnB protein [Austwickia chelonae]|uniref:Glyoxalase/fosfomycin resistance/dioxygenase domain-containing protein n=1 Tax=Austwickia chelonae NBRC 105200 TaxID=1184607 RepID=K6WBN5_9MICO|nr:VOC family protein [Austwickia chelonae]GAB79242.1 hypothetical protein AUCHE_22_00120 [Austwickia chelonae NBRC 105200]SEW37537.1 PhnB protein [Austwickia chelonae]
MGVLFSPCLSFDGTCREAMEFYRDTFGGSLEFATFGQYGAVHGEGAERVLHSHLITCSGFVLTAVDSLESAGRPARPNGQLSLTGPRGEEMSGYLERLCDGGQIVEPFRSQPWGDEFGTVVDRYGVVWTINVGANDA